MDPTINNLAILRYFGYSIDPIIKVNFEVMFSFIIVQILTLHTYIFIRQVDCRKTRSIFSDNKLAIIVS